MKPTKFICAAACVLSLVSVPVAHAAPPAEMLKPNGGKPASLDSGVTPVTPCTGPTPLQPAWTAAAKAFGLRWQVLAAITKVESDFGCNMGPSSAGAIGWTQFLPSTWTRWGTDGDGDGRADPRNSTDAVFSTARYLRVTGAPENYRKAIFAYNHADWYVEKVLRTAREFDGVTATDLKGLEQMSREAARMKSELSDLQAQIDEVPARRKALRRQLVKARRVLVRTQRDMSQARDDARDARQALNDATLQYISLAQGVAQGPTVPADGERQLMQYVADAEIEDAALVYATAKEIINDQEAAMQRMRAASVKANVTRDRYERLLAERELAVQYRRNDLTELKRLEDGLREDRRRARRQLQRFRRLQRAYLSDYAGLGTLDDPALAGAMNGLSVPERMVLLARVELSKDVREQPAGSNDSPDIARYRTAVPDGPGVGAWCAYFVSYLAAKAGAPLMDDGQGSALVASIRGWAQRSDRWTDTPRPGYLVVFANHIGMVERVEGDAVTTIEGNTSDRVARRFHRERSAVGYVRVG